MKTASDAADKVGKLIRMAGFENPAPGMKERIMNRIEVANLKKNRVFKPVIGTGGWILIGTTAVILLVLSYFLMNNGAGNPGDEGVFLRPWHLPEVSFTFSFKVPMILLLGLSVIVIWIGLDFLLDTWRWKRQQIKET